MNLMRLQEIGTTRKVDFSPVQDSLDANRIMDVSRWRSSSGRLSSYLWFTDKFRYQFGLNIYVKKDADQINTWRKNNTLLIFTSDRRNNPTLAKSVLIVNDADPMQQVTPSWKKNYTGTFNLEEE